MNFRKLCRWSGITILALCVVTINANISGAEKASTAVYQPTHLYVGMGNDGKIPTANAASAGAKYLYQYLAAGVNTGNGWATWNANGTFVNNFAQDVVNHGMTPVFTYYMMVQSLPANGNEAAVTSNMSNWSTMNAYWQDVALFFQRAAEVNHEIIFHVEPDLWGFIHQASPNNNAASYPHTIYVGSAGVPALNGLPDTPQGFAQAFFALRTAAGATNVKIAYHHSRWGVGPDYTYSNPDTTTLLGYADEAVTFYKSLNQEFDLTFAEVRDRDAGFYKVQYGDNGAAYWTNADYTNQIAYFNRFHQNTGQPVMLWQVPYGNTIKPEINNSWERFEDSVVQTLFGEVDYTTLKQYRDAGLIGVLFGGGAAGVTQPYTDGGYFYERFANLCHYKWG